ncbi:universal stress protein UspA [Haloprofundus marisrubri]|uniref:Universal stress protein UspA n=1 Tax=Haloprofundus marisrubri TaxID=1514971 RepID=A0A0W1R6G4_9EURY|nr:universal stress protein [Haloprofundus marisrubri]KTG08953.1 universal stress protein UspA [Haloprofundus marisrubri]
MYDTILVPTDGSDASAAAVEHAVDIAHTRDATVHLLHVVDVGTEMSSAASGQIAQQVSETLEQQADDALDDAVSRAEDAGVDYERVILEGNPDTAIVDYAEDNAVDLVVMGATGRAGLTEKLLGSTTDRVMRSTKIPVLLIRE